VAKKVVEQLRSPFTGTPMPLGWKVVEKYPLNNPFAYAVIAEDALGARVYFLDEVPLSPKEVEVYSHIINRLEMELTIPRTDVNPKQYFAEQAKHVVERDGLKVDTVSWAKILYFAQRDLVGFGVLDATLLDPNIEDISVDSVGKPVFVYHRKYESVPTNVTFTHEQDLDNLVARLAHMAGKHISTAFPILQGTLPGRHRIMATFRREVSPNGTTMTIRKFRQDPLTVIDFMNSQVIDYRMAAYLWLLMENKMTSLIAGSSVDYETPIIYRRNGAVKIEPIGKFADRYFLEGDGRIYTNDTEVYSFDRETYKAKWSPIQYVYRHLHDGKKMLKFRLQTGREVTVTPDHSLFILRDRTVATVPASDIRAGDFVLGTRRMDYEDTGKKNAVIDLVDILHMYDGSRHESQKQFEDFYLYGIEKSEFERIDRLGASAGQWKDWKHKGRLPLRYAGALPDKASQMVGYHSEVTFFNRLLEVDEPFARLLGYFVAEGHVNEQPYRNYKVEFTLGPKDRRIIRDILMILLDMGISAKVRKHGKNAFRISVSHRILASIMLSIAGSGAPNKRLPEVILNSPKTIQLAFLSAWMAGDAGVSVSKSLVNDVSYMLLGHGCIDTVSHKSGGRTVDFGGRTSVSRPAYQIRFPSSKMVAEDPHGWRRERIANEPKYPISGLPQDASELAALKTCKRLTGNTPNVVEQHVNSVSRRGETQLLQEWSDVKVLASSDFAFLEVLEIGEVEPTSKYVYDVSVPGNENFLAGFGGVWCHNTGAGKTTLLNALLTLTRTNTKLVTIEEVQEINIPHPNWTSLMARESYGASGETTNAVTLFDLVKAAMRMRPDIIVVGEVRGEEAYVLFQALATGHGGSCSIHADDVESVIQRLTSPPMNVASAFIPFLDLVCTVRRIAMPTPGGGFHAIRRVVSIDEVNGVGSYFNVFKWKPSTDTQEVAELRDSPKLNRLARDLGIDIATLVDELRKRGVVLRWLQERGTRNFREVSAVLEEYGAKPLETYRYAAKELGINDTTEGV
jgi:type IV secretory pathway ATPase VirB11/archaellum biosynthesis ATPase